MISVVRHPTLDSFAGRAEPFLAAREAEHNLILGLIVRLSNGDFVSEGPVYHATVERDGVVVGCAFRTPPFRLILTEMPAAASSLLEADVGDASADLSGVIGPEELAADFARRWSQSHGVESRPGPRHRIHCLQTLTWPPSPPSGSFRIAGEGDKEMVVSWIRAFIEETGVLSQDAETMANARISTGTLGLWDDGGPKAMAAVVGPTAHGIRVSSVYTPPEHRGRGYASLCVASLTRRMLESGRRFCFLYTDLANGVANRIYARLGYEPVADVAEFNFHPSDRSLET